MNKLFTLFFLISISINCQNLDLINPENNIGVNNWSIVNDDVMGGISKSFLSINEDKNLIFSLKNSTSPVLVLDNSDKNSFYVIMPMKI